MRTTILLPVFSVLALPLFGQGPEVHPLTCTSNGGARQYCPAPTRDGVLLRRDLSNGACRQGETWGYDRHGIFVSGACSAEFLVRDEHHGGGSGGNGYGQNENGYGQGGYGNNGYGGGGQNNSPNAAYQPPPPSPPQLATIPAGTQIQVQLSQRIAPDSAAVGQIVPASLTNDLVVNGITVAPAGTRVELKVVGDDRNRQYPLAVKLEHLQAAGADYHFETNVIHNANESVAAQNQQGNGSSLGNALGALLDAGAARVLPAGSVYSFQLTQDAAPHSSQGSNPQ